jgi:hypothetical protein
VTLRTLKLHKIYRQKYEADNVDATLYSRDLISLEVFIQDVPFLCQVYD